MTPLGDNGLVGSSISLFSSRKEVVFAFTWGTATATVIAGRGFPPIHTSLLSIIAVMLLSLSVYIYNDVIDRDTDAYSQTPKKKGRPIAHNKVPVSDAMKFVYITGVSGLALSYLINKFVFGVGLVFLVMFYLYSYPKVRLKRMYIMKNVVLAATLPTAILIGGAAVENRLSPMMLYTSAAFYVFIFLAGPAGTDCMDLEEDKAFGIKTIGGTLTWKQNVMLFELAILSMMVFTSTMYKALMFSYISPLLVTGFGVPVMIYLYRLTGEDAVTGSHKLRPVAYGYLMLVPLFIAIGTVI